MTRKILLSFITSFLYISTSYANCFEVSDKGVRFFSSAADGCNSNDPLVFYSKSQNIPNHLNNFKSIAAGYSDNGYSMHFNVDKKGAPAAEQTLFSFYENTSGGLPVALAGIKSNGEFFYVHGADSTSTNGLSVAIADDANFSLPHSVIIVYDQRREKLIINIDGVDNIATNIDPIEVTKIARMEIGENFSGVVNNFKTYATRMSSIQRKSTAEILHNNKY
ncbi:hypothetical protein N8772_00055 [Rickettsiales bacterium]|nr:hypothetical protein [Rickettsiales bacterium]MDB2550654.1 hypothetical protein [Rickettsiales bacterium]